MTTKAAPSALRRMAVILAVLAAAASILAVAPAAPAGADSPRCNQIPPAPAVPFRVLRNGRGRPHTQLSAMAKRRIDADLFNIVIKVSLQDQHARIYNRTTGDQICDFPVSTGKPSTPTTAGDWSIWSKDEWASSGSAVMHWMSRFHNGEGFHAIPTVNGVPLATSPGEGEGESHGCIRMYEVDANWLFVHSRIGTPVLVH